MDSLAFMDQDSSNERFDNVPSYNSKSSRMAPPATKALITRIKEDAYVPRGYDEQREPIEIITNGILHMIQTSRSPSYSFVGPFFDRANSSAPPFFAHETSPKNRRFSLSAPPYVPPNLFTDAPDFRPYADYLLDFSHDDFFRYFNELYASGNDAWLHTNIFYVKLPRQINNTGHSLFLRTLSLRNIVITQELLRDIETLTMDTLVLTGPVFELCSFQVPSAVTSLTLGAAASKPYFDEKTQKNVPYIALDPSRCMHARRVIFEGGCLWKQNGSTHTCKLESMYTIEGCVPHVSFLELILHPVELLDKTYTKIINAFEKIDTLSLRRYALGRDSFNIAPCIDDAQSYHVEQPKDTIDVKSIVSLWYERAISRIHLDAIFSRMLPFTDKKRWYMCFRAVEWQAPPDRTIPIIFEHEFPLVFIPPDAPPGVPPKNELSESTLSVYIPASHQIDKDPAAHVTLEKSSYETGSFMVFRSEKTMCSIPSTAVLIGIADQPPLLPVVHEGGFANWLYSLVPKYPFGAKRVL